jgi:hypothetical protein
VTTVPVIRSKLGTANGGTTSIQVNVPTDSTAPAVGDLLLVSIVTTAATPVITVPALGSWVQVLAPIAMGSRYFAVYRGVRGADDPTQYVFTQNNTGAAQSLLVAVPGVWGGVVGAYSKGATGFTQTTPGVTTTALNSLAISLQGEATAATEAGDPITVAAPFVKDLWTIQAAAPINSILLAHRDMPTNGATGDAVSTWPNSTGNRGSVMVVVQPLPDPIVTPVARLDAKMADGQGGIVDVGLVGWDGTQEVALDRVEYLHSGTFIPDLDRIDRVWTMGHRGGSIDYQEHSMRGYVECSINHLDVLEFSVGITSDGVLFGAHDATLNRTSSSLGPSAANGGVDVKTTDRTWAQVQALVQDLPNRGDTRFTTQPYLSLDDFVAKFAGTHTLMFDPKALSTANRQVLYSRIQQIPDYQRRVLGKFYTTGTVIADEFHAIGCKVWGYSYTDDVATTTTNADGSKTYTMRTNAGSTQRDAPKWDYLGLEHNAPAEVWAMIIQIAGPKKVIGHIVSTVAQADAAVAKGAKALQVAGVRAVQTKY